MGFDRRRRLYRPNRMADYGTLFVVENSRIRRWGINRVGRRIRLLRRSGCGSLVSATFRLACKVPARTEWWRSPRRDDGILSL